MNTATTETTTLEKDIDLDALEKELSGIDDSPEEKSVAPANEVKIEEATPKDEPTKAELKATKAATKKAEAATKKAEKATAKAAAKAEKEANATPKVTRTTSMATSNPSAVIRERLGDKLGETLVLEVADAGLSAKKLQAQQEEILTGIDQLKKKVGEKAVNLIGFVNGTAKLSVYTDIAFRFLKANNRKGIVTADLIAHYQDQAANGVKGYGLGTARSQGHQMFHLLPALKLVKMEGKTMKINPDSLISAKLKTLLK